MLDLNKLVDSVKPEIYSAGDMIAEAWTAHTFTVSKKDVRDVVTETDVAVENFLRARLTRLLPEAGFIVEEGSTAKQAQYNWTIDPIDGTKYFANRAPMFFTQVSLLDADQNPLLSLVYNPISRQLFQAVKGGGTQVNGSKCTVYEVSDLSTAIVHFDMGNMAGKPNNWKLHLFSTIAAHAYRARFTAGFLVPYMVTGAIHLSVNSDVQIPQTIKNITDLAPHKLLLTEAGYTEKSVIYNGKSVLLWGGASLVTAVEQLLSGSSSE
jgi:fructose-1,6-bisphosphatase/inositol monophosphatase family enzyme